MKLIQIAVDPSADQGGALLYGLGDDGSVWEYGYKDSGVKRDQEEPYLNGMGYMSMHPIGSPLHEMRWDRLTMKGLPTT